MTAENIIGDRPWYANYGEGIARDITVPEGPLSELLDAAAQKFGSRPAIQFKNYKLTYAKLAERAEQFAAGLRAMGVNKGDRVAIMMPNLPQTFIAFWGVQKAGAVAVMTNPLYMESELTHMVEDSQPKVMLLMDLFWDKVLKQYTPAPKENEGAN
jgi:long-chain acyl-CoA synthetase